MPSWLPISRLVYRFSLPHTLRIDSHSAPGQHVSSSVRIGPRTFQLRHKSTRTVKAHRRSASFDLLEAAKVAGITIALPDERPYKEDLSYISAVNAERNRFRKLSRSQGRDHAHKSGLSLQSIVASYILQSKDVGAVGPSATAVKEDNNLAGCAHFSDAQNQFLTSRGYTASDVRLWASIYCEPSIEVAATKMLAHSGFIVVPSGLPKKALPAFLSLQLLRRKMISPISLRCLLLYTSFELKRRRSSVELNKSLGLFSTMNESTMLILLIRLLRHARICWPAALPAIAQLFIDYMESRAPISASTSRDRKQNAMVKSTRLYNRMLSLLALPSAIVPFHSVAFHQRAQFDLVHKMAEHSPSVPITRAGYRAIVNIQLANKKTHRERDWDSLKARSWPPWKEEKTGLDAGKGFEYGTSRAYTVLNRMREAGYGNAVWSQAAWGWEKAAGILAGWDIDHSPTIQTRAILTYKSRRAENRGHFSATKATSEQTDNWAIASVWAARIRATRTIQEAWACFIAVGDHAAHDGVEIYFAMLEKLAYYPGRSLNEQSVNGRAFAESDNVHSLSSGDRKETMPEPESPKEATYVKISPPTFDGLANEMLACGVVLSAQRFGFLLTHTATFRDGLKHLELMSKSRPEIEELLAPNLQHTSEPRRVSAQMISSYIGFLCRFPSGDIDSRARNMRETKEIPPVLLALQLLRTYKISTYAPWKAVLKTLADSKILVALGNLHFGRHYHFIRRWQLMRDLLNDMSDLGFTPDNEILLFACKGLDSAVLAARSVLAYDTAASVPEHQPPEPSKISLYGPTIPEEATSILESNSGFIQDLFHKVMGTGSYLSFTPTSGISRSTPVPRLLSSPSAPVLHRYTRVLGLLQDWHSILDLVRWMVKHQNEIAAAIDMPRNGPRLLRKTIIAIRVFLEGKCWEDDSTGNIGKYPVAPSHILTMVRRQIDSVAAWGGWPSDEDVDVYCWRDRLTVE